jgi:hypothetical protein
MDYWGKALIGSKWREIRSFAVAGARKKSDVEAARPWGGAIIQ